MNRSEQLVHRELQRRLEEWHNPQLVATRPASGLRSAYGAVLTTARRWLWLRSGWLRLP